MCYCSFAGDLEKTSISAKVPIAVLQSLEHDFDWVAKLRKLKSGAGVSDAERTANRAVNYLQAQRMRDVLERSLRLIEDEEQLLKLMLKFKFSREGEIEHVEVNPKAILDLTKALESAQNMSYRALGDKLPAAADVVNENDKGVAGSMTSVRDVIAALAEYSRPVAKVETAPADAPAAPTT